jgi:COP9 signalosome complex subunit 4
VRLLLEEGEHGQAETYYNRAALLIHSTADRELQLSFKLCQARIADFNRRFYDAALRYNELSWVPELDEDDRANALSAAVTCAVLAPAGPQRSRVLATLFRDERAMSLENYTILRKMFNDHIIRPEEVQGFEATLKPHHLARVAQSQNDKLAARRTAADDDGDTDMIDADTPQSTRTGPTTVLDKAVLEHNLLSASKIYNNITFGGLGALLDLAPAAAETMARRMIEQGRLHASIDQVARLISFETSHDPRQDDAAGGAGGLGDVVQEVEDTGAPETDKWDLQIRRTAANVRTPRQHPCIALTSYPLGRSHRATFARKAAHPCFLITLHTQYSVSRNKLISEGYPHKLPPHMICSPRTKPTEHTNSKLNTYTIQFQRRVGSAYDDSNIGLR